MSDPTYQPLRTTAVYNPHLLSREEVIDLFVARRRLLDRLVQAVAESPPSSPPQHHLLVGQRGMGKTMLLRRLALAIEDDPELSKMWLPLTFPEEQYNVARLSDFWLNCVDALGDALELRKIGEEAESLDDAVAELAGKEEALRAKTALGLLLATARKVGRRLVLLVDNVDLVLDRVDAKGWQVRETLSRETDLLLIGASSQAIEATYQYKQPFYDFFEIHELGGLDIDEMRDLLLHYAQQWDAPQVTKVVQEDPGRLRALHTLTGGNPRTVVLLYTVLAGSIDGDVRTDLESLLDQVTPLYKARVEALAPQAQQVVHALAVHWHPWSAGELAEGMHLEVNAVSTQLTRLVREGVIQKVAYDPESKTGFQLAERFFNIWYLMRSTRRARRKLIWLVEFLRMFYSQEELRAHALRYLRGIDLLSPDGRLRGIEYGFALADAIQAADVQDALEFSALRTLINDESLRSKLSEIIDLEGAEARLIPRAEHQKRLSAVREQVLSARVPVEEWSPQDFWVKLAGLPIPLEWKEYLAARLSKLSAAELGQLEGAHDQLLQAGERFLPGTGVAQKLAEALRSGLMMDIDDVEGAMAGAAALSCPALVGCAVHALDASNPVGAVAALARCLATTDSPSLWAYSLLGAASRDDGDSFVRRLVEDVLASPSLRSEALQAGFPPVAQRVGLQDIAARLARRWLEMEPARQELPYVIANLLAGLKPLKEAATIVLDLFALESEETQAWLWVSFMRGAVDSGKSAEAAALLDDLGLADRFRPLREAVEAVVRGSRNYLRRVAPEIRQPAEEILDLLVGKDWPKAQAVVTPGRAKRRIKP